MPQRSPSSQAISGRFWNPSQSDTASSTTKLDQGLPPYWSTTGPTSSPWEDLEWLEAPAPASSSLLTPSPTFHVRAVSAIPDTFAHVSALYAESSNKLLEREPEEHQPSFDKCLKYIRARPHLISDRTVFMNAELCQTDLPEVHRDVHKDRILRVLSRHQSIIL